MEMGALVKGSVRFLVSASRTARPLRETPDSSYKTKLINDQKPRSDPGCQSLNRRASPVVVLMPHLALAPYPILGRDPACHSKEAAQDTPVLPYALRVHDMTMYATSSYLYEAAMKVPSNKSPALPPAISCYRLTFRPRRFGCLSLSRASSPPSRHRSVRQTTANSARPLTASSHPSRRYDWSSAGHHRRKGARRMLAHAEATIGQGNT